MNILDFKKDFTELAKKFEIEVFILFGSYADNTFTQESDIDIAYFSKKPLELMKKRELKLKIHKLLNLDSV